MHEEGATGAVGRTTSVGDRTRTCGISGRFAVFTFIRRRNAIDTVHDGVASSDTRLTVRDPRYAGHALLIYAAGANGVPRSWLRSSPATDRSGAVVAHGAPGPFDDSSRRRRAIRVGERFSVRRRAVAARGLRAHADSPREREPLIGSLAERRQHKRQPAGRRSRWTEREHLPMASPCRTRPREPEARARCGLSGSHARPSRARLAVGSSVVRPARALDGRGAHVDGVRYARAGPHGDGAGEPSARVARTNV